MAITLTTVLKNINENLVQDISNISPTELYVQGQIGKTKATHTYHENLVDTLRAPNKDNARGESADANVPSNAVVSRVGNHTQIFGEEVSVSGTADAVDTAGKGEFPRQMANAMKAIKTDLEAAIVSGNASVAGATRKLGGMEAWIKTSAVQRGGSTTPGFATNIVAAPTAGTPVVIVEPDVAELASNIYTNGGNVDDCTVIAAPAMKTKLSGILSGNATKWNNAKDKSATSAIDFYDTDFGQFKIRPHRLVSANVVIAYDPALWAIASLRPWKTSELAKTGDARKVQLIGEFTLECRNEAGNGKIAGVKTA